METAIKIVLLMTAISIAVSKRQWCLAVMGFFLPMARWLPESPIPVLNATNVLLLPVVGHALFVNKPRDPARRSDPILFPALILMVFVLISIARVHFRSDLPQEFVQRGGRYTNVLLFKEMLVGFLLYACSRRLVRDAATFRITLIAIMAGVAIQGIQATADFLGGVERFDRAEGTLGEPNELGLFIASYSMIAVALCLNRFRLWLSLPATAVGFFGVLGTLSRGALLAFGAGTVFVSFVRRNTAVILILAAAGSAPYWLPQNVIDRFNENLQRDRFGLSSIPGVTGVREHDIDRELRVHLWRAGLVMMARQPVFGVGMHQFVYSLRAHGYTKEKLRGPHNVYIWLASQAGIPAALGHLGMMISLLVVFLRLAATRSDRLLLSFGAGMAGATVSFMVGGMFLSGFYMNIVSGPFFILSGAAVTLYRVARAGPAKGDDVGGTEPSMSVRA